MSYQKALIIFILSALLFPSSVLSQERDQVLLVLSSRHLVAASDQLEKIAGGPEPLAKRLIKLRLDQSTPFVGVRAAKLLLGYTRLPEVSQAIHEDIAAEDREGLARVYAVQIDTIPEPENRKVIAERLVARGSNNPAFRPFVRVLAESKDPEVLKVAKAALE